VTGLLVAALLAASAPGGPAAPSAADVKAAVARGVAFLRSVQEQDGSFGAPRNVMFNESFATYHTYQAWTYATTGLCAMALADCGEADAASADGKALERAVDFLLAHPDLKRVSEWDTDNVWGYVYGVQAFAHLLRAPRFAAADDPRRPKMVATAQQLLAQLTRWQTPVGGWAYYDTDATTIPPVWATSFTTAACVIGMQEAKEAGLAVDEKVLNKALDAIAHSRLPNGAYDYNIDTICSPAGLEFINQVKGSLGRIQVGNVALYRAGRLDAKAVNWGVEQFFEHHKFLAVGREKPIPHESWYAVAAYFFLFGHYYASEAIDLLPPDARAKFAPQLAQKLLEIQEPEGSFWDFHISDYTRAYGTAFAVMALQRTLAPPAAPATASSR
jgi:hypothetical protein